MALKPISVSQLNKYIQTLLKTDPLLGAVIVEGEITSIKYHQTGHVYFTITDGSSSVDCFLSNFIASKIHTLFSAGDKVVISGYIDVYLKGGRYSLNVRSIELKGEGELAVEFAKLKAKLEKEGLFDENYKKPIPEHPKKIGVITSKTGAAIKDIIETATIRNKNISIMVFPVLVQGESAPAEISKMIDFVNSNYRDEIDTLIVGRGGGSAEDLQAFNDEDVARSIYNCDIPVISAVGHEIDFSISDFVADVRAATPTAAAQIAVPDLQSLIDDIEKYKFDLYQALSNKIMYYTLQVEGLKKEIDSRVKTSLSEASHQVEQLGIILNENNPFNILGKGYAVISNENENSKTVTSVKALNVNDSYKITLKDGSATCKILEIGDEAHEQ